MKAIRSILLIDDDEITIFINKMLLKKIRITDNIHTCTSCKDAFRKISELEEKPADGVNLIFLDINMPVMDGFEFVQAFNLQSAKYHSNYKIAVLSSSNHSSDKDKMKSLGVDHYYKKPLTEEAVADLVSVCKGM